MRFGSVFMQVFVYLYITSIEVFLFLLGLMESFAIAFQSLTLSNRLTVNLLAGGLLVQMALKIPLFLVFIPLIMVMYEIGVSLLQLYIFLLLTTEYDRLKYF